MTLAIGCSYSSDPYRRNDNYRRDHLIHIPDLVPRISSVGFGRVEKLAKNEMIYLAVAKERKANIIHTGIASFVSDRWLGCLCVCTKESPIGR